VEHPCYQCGVPVEDGVAFCRQCNAPQIRVNIGEVPGEPTPIVADDPQLIPSSFLHVSINSSSIQWSQALPAATMAGLIAVISMLAPFGFLGIGTLGAGAIAVFIYHRRLPAIRMVPAIGVKLGVLSGLIGFMMFALLISVEVTVSHDGGEVREALLREIQKSAARTTDPQAQVVVNWMKSPEGLAVMMGLFLFFTLVIFLILSSVGGALGATLIRNKQLRQ
jgi:hypothetical protein